jgi:hypothetical protein
MEAKISVIWPNRRVLHEHWSALESFSPKKREKPKNKFWEKIAVTAAILFLGCRKMVSEHRFS